MKSQGCEGEGSEGEGREAGGEGREAEGEGRGMGEDSLFGEEK